MTTEALNLFHGARFMLGAVAAEQFPADDRPELAFAGASNVGKSSLLNSLCNQRGLAKVSSTPGRTREINFFELGERYRFIDLPGYGYASAPMATKARFQKLAEVYLVGRERLAAVVCLFDSRRPPTERDRVLVAWLQHQGRVIVPVLTKADKIAKSGRDRAIAAAADTLDLHPKSFVVTSSHTRNGIDTLARRLLEVLDAEAGRVQPVAPVAGGDETGDRVASKQA